ncbi:MAG: adenylate/guanylate cyclase domain-containing protein [bacterium]|nr:adenylate/guanylate cyclase domain-containing protein [bacterium]
MKQKNQKRSALNLFKTVGFWLSVLLSLVVLVIYILSRPDIHRIGTIDILEIIEAKTLDFRFRLRGAIAPQDDIVIIAVDEKTEDELGRWQSSGRLWIAELLDILHEGGAKVAGFDLTFAEPDRGTQVSMVEEIQTHYQEYFPEAISDHPDMLSYLDRVKVSYNYDRRLADAIQRAGNVILGIYHFWTADSVTHLTPEKHAAHHQLLRRVAYTGILRSPGSAGQTLRVNHSFGVEPNLPMFSTAAKSFGHFNMLPDRDGFIRFTPLLVEYQQGYYPSLALEIARTYMDLPSNPLIHTLEKDVATIQLGDLLIPCDEEGKLFINYYGPGHTFPHYSLSDVVLGKIPPGRFKDKIVLFGFTSSSYQDMHSAPFQKETYPGVEINATIIENIIRGEFLTKPKTTTLVEAFIIFLLGIVLGTIRHRKSPIWGTWTALVCLLGIAGLAYAAFLFSNIWLNVTFPFLFIVVDYLAITSYKYFAEEKQKREIKNAFQHYVAPTVVEKMLESVDHLTLGGERKELTALFSDIRGFTSISEKMKPDDLVRFLNEYLSAMTTIALNYEGTVDKYMGDAIMAFYGAPLEQTDHAVRACKSAIDMIARLKEYRKAWEAQGLPFLDIGIGINSGEMSVGNMGSEDRFDYTIMGDNVNLASRLEGINKQYKTNIVISEFTYKLIQDEPFIVRELDTVQVKGKEVPVTIYELIAYGSVDPQMQAFLKAFREGFNAYKDQQWGAALLLFFQALHTNPDDDSCKMYINRCEKYGHHPPPEDWDGVFVMKTK